MNLEALSNGIFQPPPATEGTPSPDAKELQNKMLALPAPGTQTFDGKFSHTELQSRIQQAHRKTNEILKTSAILTDAYFLYTPSQIWLSALLVSDEPLALFYLSCIICPTSDFYSAVLTTLNNCAALLSSPGAGKPNESQMKELIDIDKKLYKCRNPEKIDLIGINRAQKREGDNKDSEGEVKKRKLERDALAKDGDDLFGPGIK